VTTGNGSRREPRTPADDVIEDVSEEITEIPRQISERGDDDP
jgi:hypothetical protein